MRAFNTHIHTRSAKKCTLNAGSLHFPDKVPDNFDEIYKFNDLLRKFYICLNGGSVLIYILFLLNCEFIFILYA